MEPKKTIDDSATNEEVISELLSKLVACEELSVFTSMEPQVEMLMQYNTRNKTSGFNALTIYNEATRAIMSFSDDEDSRRMIISSLQKLKSISQPVEFI